MCAFVNVHVCVCSCMSHVCLWRRSGQSVTASDFGSNGPLFESGRGRCVESLHKALYSHCPKEKAFTLASISYLAILVKYILAKKKTVM